MTEKHSPLPWQKLSGGVVASEGKQLFVGTNANAALIVRSVNVLPEAIAALEELHALVWGECPSLLNEDSGGSGELDVRIRDLLTKLKG